MENESKVMVTRHKALVEYAREIGLIDEDTPIVEHATIPDVDGKHVIGVLPLFLAAYAARVTEIPLSIPFEERGKELPLSRIREISGEPRTYEVRALPRVHKRVRMPRERIDALLKQLKEERIDALLKHLKEE